MLPLHFSREISLGNALTTSRRLHPWVLKHASPNTVLSKRLSSGVTRMTTSNLYRLPLSQLLRSYFIASASCSPLILKACFFFFRRMLMSESAFFDVERNAPLCLFLKKTLYAQYCAGPNPEDVQQTLGTLRRLGYHGVILEYAKEVTEFQGNDETMPAGASGKQVDDWKEGILTTLSLTNRGDFVGLKLSGLGANALRLLRLKLPPSPAIELALLQVCNLAAIRGVSLLVAAEEESINPGIDRWTLALQKKFNTMVPRRVVVYSTYQAYLRSTSGKLSSHMAIASETKFSLGVKLVRGAYLASEKRHLIWARKEDTDHAYDELMEALLRGHYPEHHWREQVSAPRKFPSLKLVLATHNLASVRKAHALRVSQVSRRERPVDLAYAQLQGMADEVSWDLLNAARPFSDRRDRQSVEVPKVYKCVAWGTVGQCVAYLLRRAFENQDAATRTRQTRDAMAEELWSRVRMFLRLHPTTHNSR